MPLTQTISGFFGDEWDRFMSGVQGLDPRVLEAILFMDGARPRHPGETATITIPGWDQVIKLGPRVPVTPDQWGEYYKAKRQGRNPDLPAEVLNEIAWKQLVKEANRTSAQPGWAQNIGKIMTAIDNVQDFMSTLATLGRLFLWFGARLGLRAIPGLGWVILASDLLNLMNFIGMVATPLYALLCDGPAAALAAGVPAAVLKNALCREVWTMAKMNPFGRQARAARRLAAAGRLPSISNLIEVAQTTDNLFGVGASFGAIYGAALEALFAATGASGPGGARVNSDLFNASITSATRVRLQQLPAAEQYTLKQSGRVLGAASMLQSVSDDLPDHVHISTLVALNAALPEVAKFFHHPDVAPWWDEFLSRPLPAPDDLGPTARAMLEGGDLEGDQAEGWWIPGRPRFATAEEITAALAPQIAASVRRYLEPRRNRNDARFYGALLGQAVEWQFMLFENDPEFLRWELAPDFKLLTGLATDGLLIPHNADPAKAWRFWCSMRAELDRRGGKLLDAPKVWQLARDADVPLMKLLAPDAPFPMEWAPYFAAMGDESAKDAPVCPTCGAPHG